MDSVVSSNRIFQNVFSQSFTTIAMSGLIAIVLWYLWTVVGTYYNKWMIWRRIPPAPGSNVLLGHVLPLAREAAPWNLLIKWLEDSEKPIVRFRILNNMAAITNDPLAAKRIFQTHFKSYPKDLSVSYGPFLSILGSGLVTSHGAMWQHQRLLMASALRIDLVDKVISIARRALKRLAAKLEDIRGTDKSIDIASEIRHLTLQVIGEAIMSLSPENCDQVLATTYLPIMEECNRRVIHRWRSYIPTLSWFRQEIRLSKLNGFLTETLRRRWMEHEPTPPPHDLLYKMIDAVKVKDAPCDSKKIDQMCYEIKTFLLAGHETSAAMLAWALYELLKHPSYLAKVKEEAETLFSKGDHCPKREDLDQMTFTIAVLKEVLRKYSIVPVVSRIVAADNELLCGYSIPKGTMITVSIKGVHDKYKDPDRFIPERFLPGGEFDMFEDEIRPFMFLPFIQGPRNCLGQFFALMESRYVLAFLIKNYSFEMMGEQNIKEADIIPICPENGLHLCVT